MQQLLWIETLLKLGAGLVLALVPAPAARMLGLARAETAFWPRLLGSVLLGLAAATFLEGRVPGARGLGLAGCLLVNLSVAGMLAALLVLGRATPTRRGRAVLWALVALLVLLSLFEIAHV